MLATIIVFLDIAAIVAALTASWLWYLAGRRQMRRISRSETLDAADMNRIITGFNRAALLNRRAAIATAASAALIALRFAFTLAAGT